MAKRRKDFPAWIFSITILLVGFAGIAVYLFLRTENLGPLALAIVPLLFVLGPYFGLGMIAWYTRNQLWPSVITFLAVLLITATGLISYSVEYSNYLSDPEVAKLSNMALFITAVLQWIGCIVTGLIVLPWVFIRNDLPNGK